MEEENSTITPTGESARTTTVAVGGVNCQQQKSRLTPEEMKEKLLRTTAHWTHDTLENKLGENAVLLSRWTLLLDRDEKRGASTPEFDAKEHAIVKKQLHESLGFLTKYVQLHLAMMPETSKRSLDDVVDHGPPEQQDEESNKRAKMEVTVDE